MTIEFTVDHDDTVYGSEGIEQLIGDISFTVQTRTGDFRVRDPGAPQPRTIRFDRRTAYLALDGHLYKDSTSVEPFRLIANDPAFNLDHITYRADFQLTTAIGDPVAVPHTYFPAPSTDTTLYLTRVIEDSDQTVMEVRTKGYIEDILDLNAWAVTALKGTAADARSALGVNLVDLNEISWFANFAAFPGTGVADVVYGDESNGKLYLWTGSSYIAARSSVSSDDIIDAAYALVNNSATSVLIDPSYEKGSTWWAAEIAPTKPALTLSTDTGVPALKFTGNATHYPNVTAPGKAGNDATYGTVRSDTGRVYRLSFKVRRAPGNSSAGYVRGVIYLKGASGTDTLGGTVVNQSTLTTGVWTTYTTTFAVPSTGTNAPYDSVYPAITILTVGGSDVHHVRKVRFEDITDAPIELLAPPPTGDRTTDTANLQALSDLAQTIGASTIVRLRTGTYAADVVTQKVIPQPQFIGQGKQLTQWDGTLKFQGVPSKYSGGGFYNYRTTGSHAGSAAVEINGANDVHWDDMRFEGTYDVGIRFHNELSGEYTELCNGRANFYSTITTPVEYKVTSGGASFHKSGLLDGSTIQMSTTGPAILIGSGARPYNAPMSVGVWTEGVTTYPVIQHNGDVQSNFYGNLTVEQSATAAPLAAGNTVYFAGTISAYMGPAMTLNRGTLVRVAAGLQAVSGGSPTPLPLTIAQNGGIEVYNTADQVTNYERGKISWVGNILTITAEQGGTGTARALQLTNHGKLIMQAGQQGPTLGTISLFDSTAGVGACTVAITGTGSASSGLQYGLSVSPTYNQSGTAGFTALLVNVTETATGSGSKLLMDLQTGGASKFNVDHAGLATMLSLAIGGTTSYAQGAVLSLFNTSDQTTNYERGRLYWNSNVLTLTVDKGGTGTSRNLMLSNKGSLTMQAAAQGATLGTISLFDSTGTAGAATVGVTGTGTANSGTQYALSLNPTYSQSSTAGYTVLLINPTETATGSGAHLLLDAQVGGVSKAKIDNTGTITLADSANLVAGSTTGTKLGTATSQKLGFWNATPVTQPTAVADATDATTVISQLNALLSRLRTIGLIAP